MKDGVDVNKWDINYLMVSTKNAQCPWRIPHGRSVASIYFVGDSTLVY